MQVMWSTTANVAFSKVPLVDKLELVDEGELLLMKADMFLQLGR